MSGPARTHEEIESQVRDLQAKAKAAAAANGEDGAAGVPLSSSTGLMDQAIYGNDKFAEYVTSIAANDDADDDDDDQQVGIENGNGSVSGAKAFRAPASYLNDVVDQVSYFVIVTKFKLTYHHYYRIMTHWQRIGYPVSSIVRMSIDVVIERQSFPRNEQILFWKVSITSFCYFFSHFLL